jgi:ADP-ribosylation factor GTPase-activating protein 2/3
VEDLGDESEGTGTNTPAGEPSDDFFSSWDKPAIKRPSNPPSRTGTPGINRTASPFLSAGQNGAANSRPKSPLKTSESSETTTPAVQSTASRAVSSTAVRKSAGTTSKPKSNILGAKKTKLGAKKVDAAALDFDEAEKKAREEAERKERLGYDPDEEPTSTPAENTILASQPDTSATTIHQPTPLSPGRAGPGGFGSTAQSRQRSDSEMERLGMATKRLGFGQVGTAASKSSTAAPARGLGFGAVSKPVVQGTLPRPYPFT